MNQSVAQGESYPDRESSVWDALPKEVTHYYVGTMGSGKLPVQVSLDLTKEEPDEDGDGGSLGGGFYFYERHGHPIRLVVQANDGQGLKLNELDAEDRVTGSWELSLSDRGDASATGRWFSPDKKRALPVELKLVAMGSTLKAESGYCLTELSTPTFVRSGAVWDAAKQAVRAWSAERLAAFAVGEEDQADRWIAAAADDELSLSWMANSSDTWVSPVFVSDEVISLARDDWEYGGGAHGNYWSTGASFARDQKGAVHELKLGDLFRKGTNWDSIVPGKVFKRLVAQGAGSLSGDVESSEFSDEDLGCFVLTPAGIAFAFAPYHVDGYAAGSYHATVPWSEVAGIVDAERWPFLKKWVTIVAGK